MATTVSMAEVIDSDTAVLHIPKMIREDSYGYRTSIEGKEITPLTILPAGVNFPINKAGGAQSVTLKRFADGFYTCSCPAWKFDSERDKYRKTCKHLSDVLGAQYENERIAIAKESKSSVWVAKSARRTASDSAQVRQTQARSLLDKHYQQLSQEDATKSVAQAAVKPISIAKQAGSLPSPSKAHHPPSEPTAQATKQASDSETEDEEPQSKTISAFVAAKQSSAQVEVPTPQRSKTYRVRDDDFDSPRSSPKRVKRGRTELSDEDDKVSLLLAKKWPLNADPSKPRSKAMDPTSWWLSEKLDGVRAFWDGQRLYSRQKIEWNAPAWWKQQLPKDITLDGELWMSRGAFDETSKICRTTVRLGKLQTFKHHTARDSKERQWLRGQKGGEEASQERIRCLNLAETLTNQRQAEDPNQNHHISHWRAIKKAQLSIYKALGARQERADREKHARSFLEALSGASADHCKLVLPAKAGSGQQTVSLQCAGCSRRLGTLKTRRCPTRPVSAGDAREASKARTDLHSSRPGLLNDNPICTPFCGALLPPSHAYYRRKKKSDEWNRIKFMVFDAPSMGSLPVEERWKELEKRFGSTHDMDIDDLEGPQVKLVRHIRCTGRQHLLELMEQVEAKGGEGLMLRRPGSRYEGRRSSTLYKLKFWYDAEAEVIGHASGSGRFERHTGSLVVRMENGTEFRVGTGMSDAQRENPPPIGTIINYRFFELSEDGMPRFPAFRGIARDKSRAKDAVVRPRAAMIRSQSEKELLANAD